MLNAYIPARKLQKSYKSIIEEVKTKKKPLILTSKNKPQAAIVSLEDLEELKRAKNRQNALDVLQLAAENRKELKKLPANLRKRADEILYGNGY